MAMTKCLPGETDSQKSAVHPRIMMFGRYLIYVVKGRKNAVEFKSHQVPWPASWKFLALPVGRTEPIPFSIKQYSGQESSFLPLNNWTLCYLLKLCRQITFFLFSQYGAAPLLPTSPMPVSSCSWFCSILFMTAGKSDYGWLGSIPSCCRYFVLMWTPYRSRVYKGWPCRGRPFLKTNNMRMRCF